MCAVWHLCAVKTLYQGLLNHAEPADSECIEPDRSVIGMVQSIRNRGGEGEGEGEKEGGRARMTSSCWPGSPLFHFETWEGPFFFFFLKFLNSLPLRLSLCWYASKWHSIDLYNAKLVTGQHVL